MEGWKFSEGESQGGRFEFMRDLDRETSNDEMLEREEADLRFAEAIALARAKAKGKERAIYN